MQNKIRFLRIVLFVRMLDRNIVVDVRYSTCEEAARRLTEFIKARADTVVRGLRIGAGHISWVTTHFRIGEDSR